MRLHRILVRQTSRRTRPVGADRTWSRRFGSGRVRSGTGIGTVLVLASLALFSGRAAASDVQWSGSIHVDDLLEDRADRLVEVPHEGLRIDLWSDPRPGTRVRIGQKAKIYFESNADCYVTILSIDTEGRTTRLFPRHHEDGWVWGNETYRLPDYGSHTDLRFTGPQGVERVFAVATLNPQREYYPHWLERGHAADWSRASCTYESTLYETGWARGDPLYELRKLTHRLVAYPEDFGSYNTAWANFYVGRRPAHHRACAACGGLVASSHDGCGGGFVTVEYEPDFGWIDFSVVVLPRYHYRACRTWRPNLWVNVFYDPWRDWRWCDWRIARRGHGKGRVYNHHEHGWREPDGRWRKNVDRHPDKRVVRHHEDTKDRYRSGELWGRDSERDDASRIRKAEPSRVRERDARTKVSRDRAANRSRASKVEADRPKRGEPRKDRDRPRRLDSKDSQPEKSAPPKAQVERRDRRDPSQVEKLKPSRKTPANKNANKSGKSPRTSRESSSRSKERAARSR